MCVCARARIGSPSDSRASVVIIGFDDAVVVVVVVVQVAMRLGVSHARAHALSLPTAFCATLICVAWRSSQTTHTHKSF